MARAAFGARVNPITTDYGKKPEAVSRRGQRRPHSLQSANKTASERRQFSSQEQAAIRCTLALVQGKWKIGILCRLQEGPARPGELRRLFPQASKKMLTQHLRQMERDGLIVRTDLSGKIPHVEYSLTNLLGRSMVNLVHTLGQWGVKHSSDRFSGGEPRPEVRRNAELP